MNFLKLLFENRPSKEEIWQQLCNEIDAEFVKGGFLKDSKVVAPVKEWTITLDTYRKNESTTQHRTRYIGKTKIEHRYSTYLYTRLRAPYINQDGLRFKINRRGLLEELRKFFGGQDIQVGYHDFDKAFIIQGNDPHKVIQLFGNSRIRQLIQAQPQILLEVKHNKGWFNAKFPKGVDQLYFEASDVIKDVEQLKLLHELFAETLNHLCQIGSASRSNPNFEL